MSPLARSLLALAAALLHAACAASVDSVKTEWQCTQIGEGDTGGAPNRVAKFNIYDTDYTFNLPPSKCGSQAQLVGTSVLACDSSGPRPQLQFVDSNGVVVSCSSSDGQRCPQGLDISIDQYCRPIYPS